MSKAKLLTQPGCGPCISVKKAFTKPGAPEIEEINIRENTEAAQLIRDNGFGGTPVFVFPDGTVTNSVSAMLDYASPE